MLSSVTCAWITMASVFVIPADQWIRQGNPGIRRFCDDVSFAIQKKKVTPKIIDLNFPMADTGTLNQSRESTSEPLHQNIQKLPGQVIVFGDMPEGFVPDLEEITVGSSYQVDDRQILVAEDVQSHLGNVERKKALWATINLALNFIRH